MNVNYFADTSTFIYLLDKHPALAVLLESEWHFSFITEIELLSKPTIKPNEIAVVKEVLLACKKVIHQDSINEITINLKRKYKIKLPNALIAASAIMLNIPLITFDKGFSKIKELDLILLEP
jgi:predicted nucleic acid-binding protein